MQLKHLILGLLALLMASLSFAQSFTYQGFLKQDGNPVNGTLSMTFRLFSTDTGGTALATVGPADVTLSNGFFTVELDFGTVWDGSARYLEIQVGATTLTPRVKINPTPYAVRANTANPIGGAGGDLSGSYPNPLVAGLQGRPVGTAAPANGQVLKWDGSSWAPADDLLGSSLWSQSGSHIFYNSGNVGIGTDSPSYPLHVETSAGERAIYGVYTATTTSNIVYGVYGQNNSSKSGSAGVLGWATATSGQVYGVAGRSDSSNAGVGVIGYASATSGGAGVYGTTNSNNGFGVLGNASALTGTTYGVAGQSNSPSGYGGYFLSVGKNSAVVAANVGGTVTFYSDWPSNWSGGLATYDIACAGIRYNVLTARSDERLKRDIQPLDPQHELQRLLSLRPVSYFWRDEHLNAALADQPQFGFIAQELREVFPELVLEGSDTDKTLSVNYQALIPLLVNALQVQQNTLQAQQAEIRQLREEVRQLRALLNKSQ